MRQIMLLALARELMVALWRYLSEELVPDGAALKAQASFVAAAINKLLNREDVDRRSPGL